jgi:Tol biopolymer transport system component/DNA-binding winged helix-turn-helix (wHTH) protein
MSQPAANSRVVRFGLYELDLDTRELRKSGIRIKLPEQPFLVLEMLLDRPGAIVTREDLKKKLWPGDTFVDFDLSLNSAVKKLRQALNDDSDNPRYIETLYRRGYRFIGPLNGSATVDEHPSPRPVAVPPTDTRPLLSSPSALSVAQHRHLFLYAALLFLLGLVVALWLIPSRPLRVLGYTQITHDGLAKSGLATDGQRLYFTELQGDHFVVAQVSVAGGETAVVTTRFENSFNGDVTANGSSLLIGAFGNTEKAGELWAVPLPSGPPRRLGDLVADALAWSPEGNSLYFSKGPEIFRAKADGSDPKKVATVGTQVFNLHPSPDGRRLRFDVVDPRNGSSALWEIDSNGSHPHPVLPAWSAEPRECCGRWTQDGRYFVFQSSHDGHDNLWAIREKSFWHSRNNTPVQLTNGPLNFSYPTPSLDGKRIFSVGAQPRGEVIRYDSKAGFVPFLGGISASDVDFSADGQWIVYSSIPERQLWKSKADGSERRQLTSEAMMAALPRWSPDGTQIVFMGQTAKSGWRAYLIANDGSGLHELVPGAEAGYDPNWSPDGKSIVLTLNDAGSPSAIIPGPGVTLFDLGSGKISPLPGGKQMFSPRWSPDGRYIAAITDDSQKLMLFDRETQQWQDLVNMPMGYPSWSHDGKYIYFDTTLTENAGFFRFRIADHKLEHLVSLNGMRRFWAGFGAWTALTRDDSPLLIRDISSQEIYALELQ